VSDRTALLTGITGFIGGAIAKRLLSEGWRVAAILRRGRQRPNIAPDERLSFHEHQGTGASLSAIVRETAPDLVFHMASVFLADHQRDDVDRLITSNVLFPTQLLEAMSENGVSRIVNAGTSWQHFETSVYRPVNLYAATKQAFEDVLAYYHDARKISAMNLKLFDTWGSGDTRRKLINILLDAARSGQRIDMSPGEQIVDLTHIDDVVDAFLQAGDMLLSLEEPVKKSFFVSGERHTLKSLVKVLGRALDRPIEANFGGRPYRAREVFRPARPELDEILTGWRPRRSLAQHLASAAE
jgi:nucleoside-diphosphate-sugar epimerase